MRTKMKIVLTAAVSLFSLAAQNKQGKEFPQPAPPKDYTVSAIPGVIEAGAKWTKVWQGDATADGIVGTGDGGLLFAQEQTNQIGKLDKNGKFSVYLTTAHGPGALSFGPKGRLLAVERSCTDPGGHLGVKPEDCKEPTDVAALTPARKIIADNFQGKSLGRVNDLVADKKGGAYFTSGPGAFYVNASGQVMSIGENLRTNGIILSPDEKVLYITNGGSVAAFDVQPDGSVKNQREFAKLPPGGGGDGMAVDSAGRLYVTTPSLYAIQVFSPEGKALGSIPTPRTPITLAFSGPGKKTLYIGSMGETLSNGQEFKTPPRGAQHGHDDLYDPDDCAGI